MNHDRSIATQIVALIQAEGLPVGAHLPAQMLADKLRVSRSPVNEALALLTFFDTQVVDSFGFIAELYGWVEQCSPV